eukprot:scaffold1874_cov134-Cylindrotheca_fusiformis.AAC.1
MLASSHWSFKKQRSYLEDKRKNKLAKLKKEEKEKQEKTKETLLLYERRMKVAMAEKDRKKCRRKKR